jgi:hypothetical protein
MGEIFHRMFTNETYFYKMLCRWLMFCCVFLIVCVSASNVLRTLQN